MAIVIKTFDPSDTAKLEEFANSISGALASTGLYTSVSVEDGQGGGSIKTVNAYKGENVTTSFAINADSSNITVARSGSAYSYTSSEVYVITCGSSAIISINAAGCFSTHISSGNTNGELMEIWDVKDSVTYDGSTYIDCMAMTAKSFNEDNRYTFSDFNLPKKTDADFVVMHNICVKEENAVVRSKNVNILYYIKTSIPYVLSQDRAITKFSIDEDHFVTDGYFCVFDDLINIGGDQNG